MSLTSHLKCADSPVRHFIATHFPNTSRFLVQDPSDATGHQYLLATAGDPIVCPADTNGHPWATIGTAFDYRLRLFMGSVTADLLTAHHGAALLGLAFGRRRPPNAFGQLRDALHHLVPVGSRTDGVLAGSGERQLLRLCYVLALYEQCYRGMPTPSWPIVRLGPTVSLSTIMELCTEAALDDLLALTELARSRARPLFDCKEDVLNPTFAASGLLGGADADFIADRCLVDLKTTMQKKPGRPELWQLVGYVLSDLDTPIRSTLSAFTTRGKALCCIGL